MNLAALVSAGVLREGVLLHELTTYKLGGPAKWYLEPASVDELQQLAPVDVPILVIGRGSNLVIADEGFDGLVIRLGKAFNHRRLEGDLLIAGGASPLPAVARDAARQSRTGLEWFVGVPGSVGGAVRMNAGCFGSETADVLVAAQLVDLLTGEVRHAGPSELAMSYRHSNVADHEIVTEASFSTDPGDRSTSEQRMRDITRWRRDHQPGGTLNAGSVFRNPPEDAAGAIIDRLGLKGMRVGGASVSTKHANFFVADPGASAADVRGLVRAVQQAVREATGIELQPELTFAGFD